METTTLKEEMLQYFDQLSKAEQQSLLDLIKTFVNNRPEFEPVTLEEYNKELEDGDTEIEEGNFLTHEEVKKKFIK
jgi:predicted transcriptional regulator